LILFIVHTHIICASSCSYAQQKIKKGREGGAQYCHKYIYIYIYIYICIYIYMYTYIYIYAKPCIYVYVYINIHMYAKPWKNLLLHNSMCSVSRYSFPRRLYIYTYIFIYDQTQLSAWGVWGAAIHVRYYVRFYVREYTVRLCGRSVAQFGAVRCCKMCCSVLQSVFRAMGWLRLVGCLKIYVSLQNIGLFCRSLLQKRPIFLSILLIVATPYTICLTH